MNISAILWDYDGTLVDTTKKNISVTIDVLEHFIPDVHNNLPEALTSVENYQFANYKYKNWKDLYKHCYNLSDEQVDEAGKLWSPCQLANDTIPEMFHGLEQVIKDLGHLKHGICSQNCSKNIRKTLKHFGVDEYFNSIIGYDDISYSEQKPNPSGFIKCLENLDVPADNNIIIYIGDHQEDTVFGKNAEKHYQLNGQSVEVICISASYSGHSPKNWTTQPDYIANSPEDIIDIINSLSN